MMYRSLITRIIPAWIAILFLRGYLYSQNQQVDSVMPALELAYHYEPEWLDEGQRLPVDTSLRDFHRYLPDYYQFFQSTGNYGSAGKGMIYMPPVQKGFSSGLHGFDIYQSQVRNLMYYDSGMPYTRLFYANGTRKEQLFWGLHSQNITRDINIAIALKKISSEGYYSNQKSSHGELMVSSNNRSASRKYSALAGVTINSILAGENGGIMADSVFRLNTEPIREAVQVNLVAAENSIRKKALYFSQSLKLIGGDSMNGQKASNREIGLFHSGSYHSSHHIYKDMQPDELYYSKWFSVDSLVYDSISERKSENTFGIIQRLRNSRKSCVTVLKMAYTNQLVWYHQNTRGDFYPNHLFEAGGRFYPGTLTTDLRAHYVVSGYNQGDYHLGATMMNRNDGWVHIKVMASNDRQRPSMVFENFYHDKIFWNYSFDKTVQSSVTINAGLNNWRLSAGVSGMQIKGLLYFDEFARPKQYPGAINVYRIFTEKLFRYRKWNLKAHLVYQGMNGPPVVRIPEVLGLVTLYYENYLFRGKLLLNAGIDISGYSFYYGDAYMPMIRQYHIQSESKTGNYPYMDFYLSAKVRKVRLFFKLAHFNAGLTGYTYFMTPHYPMGDRRFRLGVDWVFLE